MLEPTSTLFAAPKPCSKQAVGENPCGFCGLEGLLNSASRKEKSSLSVASNCPHHYATMNYKTAAKFFKAVPCTNVPVHCPLCSLCSCLWATTNHMEI